MNSLARLRDSVAAFITPSKRRRLNAPPTPPATGASENDPQIMFKPRDESSQASVLAKLRQPYLTPNTNPRKRAREDDEDPRESVTPEDSSSQLPTDGKDDTASEKNAGSGEKLHLAAAEQLSAEDKVQAYIDRQAVLTFRQGEIEHARLAGNWHEDEVFLFERLQLRSFEPLISDTWMIDFPTLPKILFTSEEDQIFIDTHRSSTVHAIKALQSLLGLGPRIKEKLDAGESVDKLVSKEIQKYIKWTETDGGYAKLRFVPNLVVITAVHNEEITSIARNITRQMQFLAERQREFLTLSTDDGTPTYSRELPVIYGMIVAQAKLIIVTLDSNPGGQLRHLCHFDMKEPGMDVWNGFAIAIVALVARNYTMEHIDELEADDGHDSDPDA